MHPQTLKKFSTYKSDKQKKYGTSTQEGMFYVPVENMSAELLPIRQTDEFLNRINLVLTPNQTELAIGLGGGTLTAARVDTLHGGERTPRDITPKSAMQYDCEQVNFDTRITFNTMGAFSHYDDFNDRLEREIRKHINLDMIRVGFFGKEAAANSNPILNPNGEDVAKGWIQALRENRPESILNADNKIVRIGLGGDYETVNDAVCAVKNKISPRHKDVNDLVVLLGCDLVAYDGASFYQKALDPYRPVNQIELRQLKESYGAMPAYMPSCFPARGIMVTSFDNLSIYFLIRSLRRSFGVVDCSNDCINNFESVSMSYVIEQLDKAAAINFESVQLKDGEAWQ